MNLILVAQFFVIMLLLVASAFFSGSEVALTALPSIRIKKICALRPHLAGYFSRWLERPQYLLTAIIVGNTAVNLAISSLSTAVAFSLLVGLHPRFVEVTTWMVTTAVVLVVGEIAPKIFARAYSERISVRAFPILSFLEKVFKPATSFILWTTEKITPSSKSLASCKLTLDELQLLIDESEQAGYVHPETADMMERVLSMHQRKAADIMTPASKVESVELEISEKGEEERELTIDMIVETGRTRVPVSRGGNMIGYVDTQTLLSLWHNEMVEDLGNLIRPAVRVPKERTVGELLSEFQQGGNSIVFVEDEKKNFLGIVTLEDILEEIVGEILDEYDLEERKD